MFSHLNIILSSTCLVIVLVIVNFITIMTEATQVQNKHHFTIFCTRYLKMFMSAKTRADAQTWHGMFVTRLTTLSSTMKDIFDNPDILSGHGNEDLDSLCGERDLFSSSQTILREIAELKELDERTLYDQDRVTSRIVTESHLKVISLLREVITNSHHEIEFLELYEGEIVTEDKQQLISDLKTLEEAIEKKEISYHNKWTDAFLRRICFWEGICSFELAEDDLKTGKLLVLLGRVFMDLLPLDYENGRIQVGVHPVDMAFPSLVKQFNEVCKSHPEYAAFLQTRMFDCRRYIETSMSQMTPSDEILQDDNLASLYSEWHH